MDAIGSLAPCLHHATVRFQAPCSHHSYSASTPQLQPGVLASPRNKQSATTLLCLYRRDAKSGEFVWLGEVGRFMATGADAARVNPGKIVLRVMCCDLSQIKHGIPLPYSLPLFKKNNEHHQSSKLRGGWQPGLSLLTGASAPCPA